MEAIHSSKIDTWLAALLVVTAVALLGLTVHMMRSKGVVGLLLVLPALLGAIGLPIWLVMSTRYTLTASELHIRSGPVSITVPIADIHSITPTSNPLSSPALSLDRLLIEYGNGKQVMISPEDKQQFIRDVESRRGGGQ